MTSVTVEAIEGTLRLKNRVTGLGWHPDVCRHFDPGGIDEAEARCAEANRDLLSFLRPPPRVALDHVSRSAVSRILGPDVETLRFDSPMPSGKIENDRVRVRLYRPTGDARHRRVVLFHHPVYQRRWGTWEWFLSDLIGRVPVVPTGSGR